MTCLVPENAHALGVGAAFDLQHLLALELHQPRMRQIKRNRNARHTIGREPLAGEPDVRLEANAAQVQLIVETFDLRLEERPSDLNRQITNAHVEQLLVRQTMPGKAVAHTLSA